MANFLWISGADWEIKQLAKVAAPMGDSGQPGVLDEGLGQPIKEHGWVFVGPLGHLI